MKKQHIITAAILLILAGFGGFKYYSLKHPDKVEGMTEVLEEKKYEPGTTSKDVATPSADKGINIQVEKPINGTKKGVIEVGASGFNSFVVDIDKEKNWEIVSKEFGASLAIEGAATVDDIVKGLRTYLATIFEKGVSGRNAHFVISSGALKNPKTENIARAIEKMGYVVNRVTADQEGKYAIKALLPKQYRTNSYTVDIGSGNTKITWYEGDRVVSVEASGAKYYQENKTDQVVFAEISEVIKRVPSAQRENCFIIGGVPFKLAKESRSGDERFTNLKNPDEYSAGDDVKYKSGLNIYRAIYETSGTKHFIFDWDANFTIGFLLTLN